MFLGQKSGVRAGFRQDAVPQYRHSGRPKDGRRADFEICQIRPTVSFLLGDGTTRTVWAPPVPLAGTNRRAQEPERILQAASPPEQHATPPIPEDTSRRCPAPTREVYQTWPQDSCNAQDRVDPGKPGTRTHGGLPTRTPPQTLRIAVRTISQPTGKHTRKTKRTYPNCENLPAESHNLECPIFDCKSPRHPGPSQGSRVFPRTSRSTRVPLDLKSSPVSRVFPETLDLPKSPQDQTHC
jgi:hypothetical protein